MKICFAQAAGNVSEHFGHAESFLIVEVENQKAVQKTIAANPDLEHGSLPGYLMDLGIDQIVCGGIGAGAITKFESRNISVISGASGEIEALLPQVIAGTLKTANTVCQEHGSHDHTHQNHCH